MGVKNGSRFAAAAAATIQRDGQTIYFYYRFILIFAAALTFFTSYTQMSISISIYNSGAVAAARALQPTIFFIRNRTATAAVRKKKKKS